MDFTQLKQLFTDEDAVSPVIGVILMVAITVILAAVIGTFVLGLGQNVQDSAPQANFQFEYRTVEVTDNGSTARDTVETTITHTGGEDVDASNIKVLIGGDEAYATVEATVNETDTGFSGVISTGTSRAFNVTSTQSGLPAGTEVDFVGTSATFSEIRSGETVRVVWTSPSGGQSQTIGQSTVPN